MKLRFVVATSIIVFTFVHADAQQSVESPAKGAHLGMLMSISNQISVTPIPRMQMNMMAAAKMAPRLAIEPHQVSREATVYAVFAIE
jgi:hypothetical protein